MSAIVSPQVTPLFSEGGGQRTLLLRISGVTTGDTIDLSTIGPIAFRKLQAATFIAHALASTGTCSVSTTTLTLTLSTMALDTIDLLVLGES